MPRTYKPKPGGKRYKKEDPDVIKKAVAAVKGGMSYRKAKETYGVPTTVIFRHLKNPHTKHHGGRTALDSDTEEHIINRLITCGNWGFPLDTLDLRFLVKSYLDRRGINERKFKDNMPGQDWVESFLKRHKGRLAQRMCQNIKRSRAEVSRDTINEYFDNLASSLEGIPSANILNYDETNLADDPGRKKVILRRGTKYPERIMNSTKSATSLMCSSTADGTVLPMYVVYKATNLYDTWTMGGPKGTRYNRSKSGWFDSVCFSDWFKTIALPHLQKLEGKKVLIGDNLSSHLTLEVIQLCEEHDIKFVFLPPNSTHLCQPLDVSFFRPMKMAWRKTLEKWKKGPGRKQASVPKDAFPHLLQETMRTLGTDHASANSISGFSKCGIVPLDREKVLARLPSEPERTTDEGNTPGNVPVRTSTPVAGRSTGTPDSPVTGTPGTAPAAHHIVDDCFVAMLREMRHGETHQKRKRKKKINVQPGKSVEPSDFSQDDDETAEEEDIEGIGDAEEVIGPDEVTDPEEDEDESAGLSESSKDESESENTKSSLKGVLPVASSDLQIGMWLVVNFSMKGRQLYLGRVEKLFDNSDEFEAVFLRPSQKSMGSSFDCTVHFHQVIGKTCIPEQVRRGILKFDVNSNQW